MPEQEDKVKKARPKKKTKKKAAAIYDPKCAHGPPAVGFPAKIKPPPWMVKAGESFGLDFMIRSAGGKGRGIFVQLEGEALAKIELSHASIGEMSAPFEDTQGVWRAELPDIDLVAGVRYPLDPAPKNDKQKRKAGQLLADCHMILTVHGSAKDASRELLRVSCGALESPASAMKWMRPLLIE